MRLGSRKAEELIALLACEAVVSKREAATLLWPEAGPEQAMDSLYKLCARMRVLEQKGLTPPLETEDGRLSLRWEGAYCDLRAFDALYARRGDPSACAEAISLYRPLLCEEGYDWAVEREGVYDIRYLSLLEQAVSHYEAAGLAAAAGAYRRLLEE